MRTFLMLGGDAATLKRFDKHAGYFGRGGWRVVLWNCGWRTRWEAKKLARQGAKVEILPRKLTAEALQTWLDEQPAGVITALMDVGGLEKDLCQVPMSRLTQLYLKLWGHLDPDHDWPAEVAMLERLRAETRLGII